MQDSHPYRALATAAVTSNRNAPEQAEAVRAALAGVLASPPFARSPCMRRLLRYLVEASLDGQDARPSEYRIGLEALGKNPRTYSPQEDPSVRVQVGRLRERLGRYYADAGAADPLRFEIPNGSYTALIHRSQTQRTAAGAAHRTLLVSALQALAEGRGAVRFALGLREELMHRLHRELGGLAIVSPCVASGAALPSACTSAAASAYRLEGSVRQVQGIARATLRLVDPHSECVLWCERFDQPDEGVLQTQEALSTAICARLRHDVFAPPHGAQR
ncbi:hypothetical protein [Xanthomonas rydalmerensis]|uniref:Uncharacterized protein n=1 Tax=Xanthomonas rydalmerensis TaxID=3046274 RepID=A0ABZ0JMW3_9XANT|nr:hypothetical protein [Xanthomonas sp. DM-2023]WOS41156.1 hypothetical protein QN243_01335 [Xanthomonas sp. DM-2023]WOS45341.1 hypothetical protein QN242_01335 [Xanthomonas sp. DM-2023]WOS49520.1 hypothetical protein QN240_01335 [Xanthomonas sp. DM-2023]WOS53700.1 hypothetical protein QN244_01335 [Xanthomonas sp. DM-2023]WOS57883.1 hypothetical protein QN245_01335 [Xanthomonas sp. DM-2023]